ncbi:MAG: M28 family peptidase [Anaerolineales bacterium]|nr:M28 family peptidase [Anaerolineales bacterium]
MKKIICPSILFGILLVCACSTGKTVQPTPEAVQTEEPSLLATAARVVPQPATALPPTATSRPDVPYDLISQDSLFDFLTDLTGIQPYSGWRSAGSTGEAEGFAYVADKLAGYSYLSDLGMSVEQQSFPVFLTVEFWESRLYLTVDGQEVELPASGLRGSRYDTMLARNFDSDGGLNDSDRNPISAAGAILVIRDPEQLEALQASDVAGRVLFMNYALIDYFVSGDAYTIAGQLAGVIAWQPAGLVLVTQNTNQLGQSHGTVIGDGGVFQRVGFDPKIPIVYVRLEDLSPAGIMDWDDLAKIGDARLIWDADVYSPGESGNLIAHIPGADPSQAVILGAHMDSPNSPGALDDGSGCVVLLEIARVLNLARLQPPVDLYLVWFGSHEIGIYGSAYFAATHQELLDRALAMLQMDCLGYPLNGSHPHILAEAWSYGQYGDERLLWPDYLSQIIQPQDVVLQTENIYGLISDNSNFSAFNLPNLNLEYFDHNMMAQGRYDVHYLSYLHDPYETVELAQQVGDALEGMAKVALAAAVETGLDQPALRAAPVPRQRALFVASHTEPPDVAPTALLELGMALAWEGIDADLIPYGQTLSAADLENVGLVLLMPTLDYPGKGNEKWSAEEIDLLEQYVLEGGFLILTNTYHNISMNRLLSDSNEDSQLINILAERMGIRFKVGVLDAAIVESDSEHPLMTEAQYLKMFEDNGVPFEIKFGQVLATAQLHPIIALVDHGQGQVLVIGDIGLLVDYGRDARNLDFVKNIARYVAER